MRVAFCRQSPVSAHLQVVLRAGMLDTLQMHPRGRAAGGGKAGGFIDNDPHASVRLASEPTPLHPLLHPTPPRAHTPTRQHPRTPGGEASELQRMLR